MVISVSKTSSRSWKTLTHWSCMCCMCYSRGRGGHPGTRWCLLKAVLCTSEVLYLVEDVCFYTQWIHTKSTNYKASSEKGELILGWWSVKILSLGLVLNPDIGIGIYGKGWLSASIIIGQELSLRGTSVRPCLRHKWSLNPRSHHAPRKPHPSLPCTYITLQLVSPKKPLTPDTDTHIPADQCCWPQFLPLPHVLQALQETLV